MLVILIFSNDDGCGGDDESYDGVYLPSPFQVVEVVAMLLQCHPYLIHRQRHP
jgi:hypothetical protein